MDAGGGPEPDAGRDRWEEPPDAPESAPDDVPEPDEAVYGLVQPHSRRHRHGTYQLSAVHQQAPQYRGQQHHVQQQQHHHVQQQQHHHLQQQQRHPGHDQRDQAQAHLHPQLPSHPHHQQPQHHHGLGRSASVIGGVGMRGGVPSVGPATPSSSVASPIATGTATGSASALWRHFERGEKMQKTNKFLAHCRYCKRPDRQSATRGEKRMMSSHLQNCKDAPDEARREGAAVAMELKARRVSSTSRTRGSTIPAVSSATGASPAGPSTPVGGVGSGGVNKRRTRRSSVNIPAAAAASASAGVGSASDIAAVAAAAAATALVHAGDDVGVPSAGGTTAHYAHFDPGPPPPPVPAYSMPGSQDGVSRHVFQTNDHVGLYYEEAGNGPAVIMLHGWSGSHRSFDANFIALSNKFRVIRVDMRGHGDSDKPQYGFHVHRLAMDLHNLIEHLRLSRVTLLGTSLGCAVIWAYVELFGTPNLLSACIFVDQAPWQNMAYDGSWKLGSKGIFSEASLAHQMTLLAKNPQEFFENNVKACFTRTPTTSEVNHYVNESLKAPVEFLSKLMADHTANDWRKVLPFVTCPCLVIAGKRSKIFPVEGVKYAADHMPNAKLITFEEGSHWLYIEEFHRFNNTVEAYVESVTGNMGTGGQGGGM